MKPLGAQISRMLRARGAEVIFGIPGVHNIEMYRGFEETGLTHILARHEQGAAFMADGYARASGKPGLCYLITGPGFVNALTALGQSWSDSVPVLALASCLDETTTRAGQLHQMRDQQGAGDAVCDWSLTARSAEAAYTLIDRAFTEFAAARPRPKALHLPISLLSSPAGAAHAAGTAPQRPKADHATLYAAIDRVLCAEKPLFIFGGGARRAAKSIPHVLRQTGAASFTTIAGRGLVPPESPLHFGSFLPRPGSAAIIGQSDLVIAVGTELSETDLWRDTLGARVPMIRVDLDPGQGVGLGPDDMMIHGDAAAFLEAMAIAIPARTEDRPPCWDARHVSETRQLWRAEVMAERPYVAPVTDCLRAALPQNAMIFSDMTQMAYGATELWDMPRPGHWHHPSGFGTLGYALPAAIGGAVARKGLPTVALIGDYGLQYTLPELATAVELGLPLPILLWDNSALGEIHDAMQAAQIAPTAVQQRNPDFIALAKAYGADAAEPASLPALSEAVRAALLAPRPTLIRMTPQML